MGPLTAALSRMQGTQRLQHNVLESLLGCASRSCASFALESRCPSQSHLTDTAPLSRAEGHKLAQRCWDRMLARLQHRIAVPREVVWLNGAPGAGKGTTMGMVKRCCGLSRDVTTSSLLSEYAPARIAIASGGLVSDELVVEALMDAVLNPKNTNTAGMIVDGFPRTAVQVGVVEWLLERLQALHSQSGGQSKETRPRFRSVVLHVDEATSISRQRARHAKCVAHNQKVMETRSGSLMPERETDKSVHSCRARFQTFQKHYGALTSLRSIMPFTVVNAMGTLQQCESQIEQQLSHQEAASEADHASAALYTGASARGSAPSTRSPSHDVTTRRVTAS